MRIGFIGDIHEDLFSLQNALRLLSNEKCDMLVCLGDIVGFALPFYRFIDDRNAEECVRLVMENCTVAIAGNHDLYAVKKVPLYQAGFNYENDWYSLEYEVRAKKARNKIWLYEDNEIKAAISEKAKEYLSGLKEMEIVEAGNYNFLISHFCFPDFSGSAIYFPFEVSHLKKHYDFMTENKCRFSFSGHGHPEGVLLANTEKFSILDLGSSQCIENQQWIVAPCIARTTRPNGVVVLDTSISELKAISLKEICE